MEHRWGKRHAIDLPVRLDARPHVLALARLSDASSSGAYLKTRAAPPPMTRVHVELKLGSFRREEPYRIPAYVVRADDTGVGLEWCEFAPAPILALIENPQQRVGSEWRRSPPHQGLYLSSYGASMPPSAGSATAAHSV